MNGNKKNEGEFCAMKKLAAKKNVECMACLQCVAACSEAFYKEFDEEKSCVRIVAKVPAPSQYLHSVRQVYAYL